MLILNNLTKKYGKSEGNALDSFSLILPRGEIVGIFGENGAGKTTMMKSVLNLHSFEGEVTLDGEVVGNSNITKLSFATCEHSFFSNINGEAHREFYASHFPNFREKRFARLMEFFELPMNKKISKFSTGQQNQFEVILALCQGADYIFMDEPFAGNDIFNREDFYKVLLGILEERETVILSTHLIDEVEHFIGRAVLMSKGKVIDDCTSEGFEEVGLANYIKARYQYQSDRVSRALDSLSEQEEETS
ncbi:MAG: ABC transporter ATP-binding protein [Eubacteriales bacterium]